MDSDHSNNEAKDSGQHVWFSSSVGGGVFGGGQVEAWRGLGLDARLLHLVDLPDYWRAKAGPLTRLWLRYAMYMRYPWMLRRKVKEAMGDEIFVVATNPFYGPALAARASNHSGARVVHLVYDLYPDALGFGRAWPGSSSAIRFATWSTRAAIAQCAATVYLGERLRRYAEKQYGEAPITAVIPVGSDVLPFQGHEPAPRERSEVRCLYSGHMGRLHDVQTLALSLEQGLPDGVIIEIAADGLGANTLKDFLAHRPAAKLGHLIFSATRELEEWRMAMLAADVAIVTMRPGAENVVMPSKTYSAMAAGQAILAICSLQSDLADTVLRHKCGWIVAPGDVAGMRRLLESLPFRGREVLDMRRRAYSAAQTYYSMDATAKQWAMLFNAVNEY
jgi:glycosyltransferase involved in cell wall biosynthesis